MLMVAAGVAARVIYDLYVAPRRRCNRRCGECRLLGEMVGGGCSLRYADVMNTTLFDAYTALNKAGRKKEAKQAITRFVRSFGSFQEKEAWTREFLPSGDFELPIRMRHELYEGVVFPVLLDGYRKRDPWSLLWLAKTVQNLYSAKALYRQIDLKDDTELLQEARALDSDSKDIRRTLLKSLIGRFDYCEHEWPPFIILGPNGDTPEEFDRVLGEVALARELDKEGQYSEYLSTFESRVQAYWLRLASEI